MQWYNDSNPHAAEWLRNLIAGGHLADGVVKSKSIVDVRAFDIPIGESCHFFAGIGGWPLALDLAGWPSNREVWTGSCPCQPFSGAGQGRGFADERHLWPEWFRLIGKHRPRTIFGEQVEGPAGRTWLDLVFADLEGQATPAGRSFFLLRASARRTGGIERTGWPTPRTETTGQGKHGDGGMDLRTTAQLAGWPTPCSQDGPNGGPSQGIDRLPAAAALTGWPTPDASVGNISDTTWEKRREEVKAKHNNGNGFGLTIGQAAMLASGPTSNGSPAATANGGQLNPDFSRWLMGLPPEWDACAPTATRFASRKQSSS